MLQQQQYLSIYLIINTKIISLYLKGEVDQFFFSRSDGKYKSKKKDIKKQAILSFFSIQISDQSISLIQLFYIIIIKFNKILGLMVLLKSQKFFICFLPNMKGQS